MSKKNIKKKAQKSIGFKVLVVVGIVIGLLVVLWAVDSLFKASQKDLYPDVSYYWLDKNGTVAKDNGKKVTNPYYPYLKKCLKDNVFANTDWGGDGMFHGTRPCTKQEAAVIMTNVYGMDVTAKLLQGESDGSESFTFEWLKAKMLEVAGVKKIGVEWDVDDRLDQTVTRYDMAKAMIGFKEILLKK